MGLKGIPSIISPDLMKALAEMGHGDNIVLADAHFPAHSLGRKHSTAQIIRADGVNSIAELMAAILQLIDLDGHVSQPIGVMDLTDGDKKKGLLKLPLPVWMKYLDIAKANNNNQEMSLRLIERFKFYEEAGEASVIVITSDTALYGNIMLTKGVLPTNK